MITELAVLFRCNGKLTFFLTLTFKERIRTLLRGSPQSALSSGLEFLEITIFFFPAMEQCVREGDFNGIRLVKHISIPADQFSAKFQSLLMLN